jgi:cytochrome c oxidase cbb3-type subunit I/II
MERRRLILGLRQILAGLIVLLLPSAGFSQEQAVKEQVDALQAKVDGLTRKAELERGRTIYFQACSACHGIRGDGKGPAARGFDPAPRNFRRGVYKFRTTVSGALPLDQDLERTVREGVPNTEMPRWKDVLSEHDIRAVVQYIKSFSPSFEDRRSLPQPKDIVQVPEFRPSAPSPASVEAGRQIFIKEDCVKCHGKAGAGDGVGANKLEDDWKVPIRPPDLTLRHFKNGKRDRDIFLVFTTGLNGTPMPAFDDLTVEQRWQLVDYIQSLEQRGLFYWLFKENPNQVRHPDREERAADPRK